MMINRVSETYGACPQITPEDVAEIAALGYRAIMCNRPDNEDPGQTPVAEIRAAAEQHGLAFAFVPVLSSGITEANLNEFTATLDTLPAPVLAYCRSGTRSHNLWKISHPSE